MTDIAPIWIALAVVAGLYLFHKLRGRRSSPRRGSAGPVDVEGDLLRACHGDRAQAERLIAHELERNHGLSRTGAAVMALAKLRDDRR